MKTLVAICVGVLAAGVLTVGWTVGWRDDALEPSDPPLPMVARAPNEESAPPPRPAVPPATVPPGRPAPALALLEAHLAGTEDATETLWRFDEIARLVGRPGEREVRVPATAAVTPLRLDELARGHDRIVLAAGVFEVVGTLRVRDEHATVEIRGAGRGETLLRVPGHDAVGVSGEGALAGLVVRDLTFDGDLPGDGTQGDLLDVRGAAAAIFERVTFRNWGWGGYGAPVGSAGRLLVAFRDCLFLGGYKRGALRQAGLAVRGPMLFLFDRCHLTDLQYVLGHMRSNRKAMSPRSRGHFLDCTFDNSPLVSWWWADGHPGPWYPICVRGGSVRYGGYGQRGTETPSELEDDRRRAWVAAAAASLDRVRFENAPIHCTAVHLRRVLEAYEPPPGKRVVAVKIYTWHGCRDPVYGLFFETLRGPQSIHFVHLRSGRVVPASADGFDLRPPPLGLPGRGATLLELVEAVWDRLDRTRPIEVLSLVANADGESALLIQDRRGRTLLP